VEQLGPLQSASQPLGIGVLGKRGAEYTFRRKTLRRLFSYGLYLPIQWEPNKESGSLTNFARERECPPVLVDHHRMSNG
jgi:hypothetical protein